MHDYVKPFIEKIEFFLKNKAEKVELLLIGGLAMSFYNVPRFTIDIDAEIKCSDRCYDEIMDFLKKEDIAFNISDNIDGWGIIPLPGGYRGRSNVVYESDYLKLNILDPVDFVFSKILRGTEEDFTDIIEVIKIFHISEKDLKERETLIKFPKDTETFFFRKKFVHLLALID